MNDLSPTARVTREAPWVARLCALLERVAEVRGSSAGLWEGGVRVTFDLTDDSSVIIDVMERGEGRGFAVTPSFTVLVRADADTTLSETGEKIARAFGSTLRRLDRGGMSVPVSGENAEHVDGTPVGPSPDGRDLSRSPDAAALTHWQDGHAQHEELLHQCSFLALQSTIHEDLYPHCLALGEPISEADIQESWRVTSKRILAGTAPKKLGLYIHIPFCTVECSFCYCGKTEDFNRSTSESYFEALLDEMRTYGALVEGNVVTSVYVGGGTPSLLPPPAMRRFFETLYSHFDVPEGTQVIFEGNPDSLKPDKVEILGTLGRVSRLTIGVQTLDPEVQKYVRRYNRPEDIRAAIEAARRVGIPHVNFDCIAGLDGQTLASWQHDVEFLLSLQPDTLHMNGFKPLPRTRYAKKGRVLDADQVRLRDEMLAWGTERLEQEGFGWHMGQTPRRTLNAANLQVYDLRTQNSSLIGMGFPARAHSFGGFYYTRDVGQLSIGQGVRREIAEGRRYWGVPGDDTEEMHKYIVTNIRGDFERSEFRALFGQDAVEAMPDVFSTYRELGMVDITDTHVRFHAGDAVQAKIYRYIAASQAAWKRAWDKWGHEYDRGTDYTSQMHYLMSAE